MPVVHREVERTYAADATTVLPSLAELAAAADGALPDPGTALTESTASYRLRATYFDTADLRLATAGLTLRRRTGGADDGWHLKVPAGTDARSEVRLPPGRAVRTVPAALRSLVWAVTRGAPLRPVAELETEREARRLVGASGRVLLELADDRVTGRRMLPTDGSGDAVLAPETWREVEVELVDAGTGMLDAVERVLAGAGLRPVPGASKVGRVLGHPAPPRRPAVTASSPAGDVVVAYAGDLVATIVAQDLAVRLGAPDAVHQMRVATRRLRSALRTFEPLLQARETRPLRGELRWLAGELGAARDAEVLQARVRAAVDAEHAGEAVVAADPAVAVLGRDRDEAYRRVLAVLDGDRYRGLLRDLHALVAEPPLTAAASRRARKVLPALVAGRDARVRRLVRRARSAPPGARREGLLHEARKAAKNARYAGEAVRPALGRDAKRYARAMEAVQEVLGEHQDSVVTRARLHDLAGRVEDPVAAFRYGRLHAAEERRGERAQAELRGVWKAARRKRLRRWLG